MRRFTRCSVLAFLLAHAMFAGSSSRAEEITSDLEARIARLMEVTGSAELGEQMASAMTQHMVSMMDQPGSEIPREVLDIIRDVALEVILPDVQEIHQAMVPLFAKHFTSEDVDAILQFYETPAGRKSIEVMPAIMEESMQIGAEWAQAKLPEFRSRLALRLGAAGHW